MKKQKMTDKKYIVVAYDIASNRRRRRVARILESYGNRVNYSVFECFLRECELGEMQHRLQEQVKRGADCILFYRLCRACIGSREIMGRQEEQQESVCIC